MSPRGSPLGRSSPITVVSAAALLNLCLGSSCAWSVVVEPLLVAGPAVAFIDAVGWRAAFLCSPVPWGSSCS